MKLFNDLKKLFYLLNKNQIKKLIMLSGLLFFAMILELIGLGAILPLSQFILFPANSIEILNTSIFGYVLGDIKNINNIILFLFFLVFSYLHIFY